MCKNTGVKLTAAGRVLLSHAESITREMKNMVSEINSLSFSTSHGRLLRLSVANWLFTFLSGMIKKFKEVFPKARVSMYEAQLSSFLPAIRDGWLDFAIGTLSDGMQLQDLTLSHCLNPSLCWWRVNHERAPARPDWHRSRTSSG